MWFGRTPHEGLCNGSLQNLSCGRARNKGLYKEIHLQPLREDQPYVQGLSPKTIVLCLSCGQGSASLHLCHGPSHQQEAEESRSCRCPTSSTLQEDCFNCLTARPFLHSSCHSASPNPPPKPAPQVQKAPAVTLSLEEIPPLSPAAPPPPLPHPEEEKGAEKPQLGFL
ncbi:hypothetical protein PRIEUP_LOCUS1417 [Pristimantis euphronides]